MSKANIETDRTRCSKENESYDSASLSLQVKLCGFVPVVKVFYSGWLEK